MTVQNLLDQYNPNKSFEYDNTVDRPFTNLKELDLNVSYIVQGMFINDNSYFGKTPVVVTPTHLVNLPQHLTETIEQMRSNDEIVDLVNAGAVGFNIYEYQNKFGTHRSIRFVAV